MVKPTELNEATLLIGIEYLCQIDAHLAQAAAMYGPPPLWAREEGFATLIRIILEQQVSLQSAKAAFDKLADALERITPKSFLSLSDESLKTIGFSRQKTRYGRELAHDILRGNLDLHSLSLRSDHEVRTILTKVKGIGPWTANIYLLMALKRPDVWPRGDLALEAAAQKLLGLKNKPSSEELFQISRKWQPWRAVAARLLYQFYLKGNTTPS